jgi:glutamate synthase (NADPH/NADH) large chain
MSGGVAYVWDKDADFKSKCNMGTFELENVKSEADVTELRRLIENHLKYTDSAVADHVLANWSAELPRFLKVMPTDYKRVLEEMAAEEELTAAVGS